LPNLPSAALSATASQQVQALAQRLQAATAAPDSAALLAELYGVYRGAGAWPHAAPLAALVAQLNPTLANVKAAAEAFREAAQHATVRPTPEAFQPFNQNAVYWYSKWVEMAPQDTNARLELALRYVDSETPMAGIATLREIVQQNPRHYKANLYLGLFSLRSNQRDKAVERLRAAIAADPTQAEPYYYLGSVLMEQPSTAAEGRQLLLQAQQRTQDPALRRLINSQLGS
jgi:Flp pilus assembly protein TadD